MDISAFLVLLLGITWDVMPRGLDGCIVCMWRGMDLPEALRSKSRLGNFNDVDFRNNSLSVETKAFRG